MARVKLVKPEKVEDPQIQGVFEWITQMEGAIPNHFFVEMNFPELFKALLETTRVLWTEGELPLETVLQIGVAVSKENGSPYCTAAFCTNLSHGLGKDRDQVLGLARDWKTAELSDRDRQIVDFAVKVNAAPASITDQDIQRLRDLGLSDSGIIQVIHAVSNFAAYNRLNVALKTDYDYDPAWLEADSGPTAAQGASERKH